MQTVKKQLFKYKQSKTNCSNTKTVKSWLSKQFSSLGEVDQESVKFLAKKALGLLSSSGGP